jgi:hypothetical protein
MGNVTVLAGLTAQAVAALTGTRNEPLGSCSMWPRTVLAMAEP